MIAGTIRLDVKPALSLRPRLVSTESFSQGSKVTCVAIVPPLMGVTNRSLFTSMLSGGGGSALAGTTLCLGACFESTIDTPPMIS